MLSSKRIVHILEAFTGGTLRHLVNLLDGLSGWEQSAIVSVGREERAAGEVERLRSQGCRIDVVSMERSISPLSDALAFRQIVSLLREIQPGIVHCHSAKAGFLGRAAGVVAGVPVRLYTPHALPFHPGMSWRRSLFYGFLERLAGKWTTGIIAVSPSEAKLVQAARLVDPSRIHVIPNGVALSDQILSREDARRQLGLPVEGPLVLCVAHLRPQKSPLDWLEMATLVLQERPDCLFAWAGDGELRDSFLARAASLPPNSFHDLGFQHDPSTAFSAADVFTLSSLYEGCPYALLEAMSWGLPCAATAVPGSEDAIQHGRNGILSPAGDPGALANSVLKLLNDPAASAIMGLEARSTIEKNYSPANFLSRHDELYGRLLTTVP